MHINEKNCIKIKKYANEYLFLGGERMGIGNILMSQISHVI